MPRSPTAADDELEAPTPAELVASARRFHRRLRRELNDVAARVGISYAQFELLDALASDPNHHAASMAGHLGTSRQAVSVLVRKLFEAELLEPLAQDRGVRGLRLTERGHAVLARCHEALEPLHLQLGRLDPEARATLCGALNAAEAALRPPPRWSV